MSLRKTVIPVDFSGGLNSKTADQKLMPGEFIALENCVRRKTGRIEKRHGFELVGASLGIGTKLARHNDELLAFSNTNLFSYSETSNTWVSKGDVPNVIASVAPLISDTSDYTSPDGASVGNISLVLSNPGGTGPYLARIQDESNQDPLVIQSVTLSAPWDSGGNVINARCVTIGTRLFVVFITSNHKLGACYFESNRPTVAPVYTSAALATDADETSCFDISPYTNTAAVFAYNSNSANVVRLGYILYSNVLGSPSAGYPGITSSTVRGRRALAVYGDAPRQAVYLTSYDGISGTALPLNVTTMPYDFSSSHTRSDYAYDFNGSPTVDKLGITYSGGVYVYISLTYGQINGRLTDQSETFYQIYSASTTDLGFQRTGAPNYNVSLVSKPFPINGQVYAAMMYNSGVQGTLFLIREDGAICGRLTIGNVYADVYDIRRAVASVYALADGSLSLPFRFVTRSVPDIAASPLVFKPVVTAIYRAKFTFNTPDYQTAYLGTLTHIAGALPYIYDGLSIYEQGFNNYPDSMVVSATTGGNFPNGVYQVAALYEWYDNNGQQHQSIATVQQAVTLTGSDTAIAIVVPNLNLTNKIGVRLVGYVSDINGVILYRAVTVPNVSAIGTTTLVATVYPGLVDQEVLYTTGGVLDNAPMGACSTIIAHKNRLWAVQDDDINRIQYSKEYQLGVAPAFSDGFVIQVDPLGGPITALGSLDDKLTIFKARKMFALSGEGPVDTGAQNDYEQPTLVSGDTGCIAADSVVIMPEGLMFQSDKGIYILERNLNTDYAGAAVEKYNSLSVTSAQILEDTNEVRFTTSNGQALVYNYYFNQWSTFTNYASVSGLSLNGKYYHMLSNGSTYVENDGYLDAGARIKMAIETGWLSFAGLQGYQRLYRFACLGDFLSDHYTTIQLSYDFEDAYTETFNFNVANGLALSYYGDSATYGSDVVFGGETTSSGVFQFSSKPRRQKCESVKIRLEDIDSKTLAGGGSFNLVSLTLELGIKGTLDKLGGSKQIGSL